MSRRPTLSPPDLAQQRAFLHSIQEAPDDDAPRLIYADWLDEHGDPDRADFIRTQCRLEALSRDDPRRRELRTRETDLLRRHRSAWLGPWDSRSNEATFRRGFLDEFRVGSNFGVGLSSLVPALSPYHDLTRSFAFQATKLAEGLLPLLGEALPCLRRLELENCFRGNALVEAMAAWPASAGLAELVIRRSGVGSVGVVKLAEAPWLASLRALDLRDNLFDQDALTTLLLRPEFRSLEGLAITAGDATPSWPRRWQFTGTALTSLLSGNLRELRRLRVQDAAIRDEGLRLLAESPALARFTSLELPSCGIGDVGAIALAESPHARQLRTLNLRTNVIGDAGVLALAGSPHLSELTSLDLYGITFQGNYGVEAALRLVESPFLRNLVTLRISPSGSAGEVAEALRNPRLLPKLRDLVVNVPRSDDLLAGLRARGVELTGFYGGD